MNIEQELITAINKLLDEALASGEAFTMCDIARRAIERHGCKAPLEAVIDLAGQVFTQKNEPWMALPGTRLRLKDWGDDAVVPLIPKATVLEMLDAGSEAGEPLEVTLERVGRAYPRLTGDELDAEISAYRAWLDDGIERQRAQVRALDRVCAICKPVWDEDSSVPIDEALQVMADRGSEAAQRELASWGPNCVVYTAEGLQRPRGLPLGAAAGRRDLSLND